MITESLTLKKLVKSEYLRYIFQKEMPIIRYNDRDTAIPLQITNDSTKGRSINRLINTI